MSIFNHKTIRKIIALSLILAMLWQEALWADPGIVTATLAPRDLMTGEDKALSLKMVVTRYLHEAIHTDPSSANLAAIGKTAADIIESTTRKLRLAERERPQVSVRILRGTVKIEFADGTALLFYNPKYPYSEEEWRGISSPDRQVLESIRINDTLHEQVLASNPADKKSAETNPRTDSDNAKSRQKDSQSPSYGQRRFGKVEDPKLRKEGRRYYMIQEGKPKYFHFRWDIFASLDHQIIGNIEERELLTGALEDITEIQSVFKSVKGIKASISAEEKTKIENSLKGIFKMVGGPNIQLSDKRITAGHIKSALEYFRAEIPEDAPDNLEAGKNNLRRSYANLSQAMRHLEERRKSVERIYANLRKLMVRARAWAEEENEYMAGVAASGEKEGLVRLANRFEIKEPENEPEFEGVDGLLRGAIRDISSGYLQKAGDSIRGANVLMRFMAEFKDAYYDSRYAGSGEAYAKKIFLETWLKYLKDADIVRGSPACWQARFYQAAFIHRTKKEKFSQKVSNPLFEASTTLIHILYVSKLDSILKTPSLLKRSSFPAARNVVENFRLEKDKSRKVKNTVYDLSQNEKVRLIKALANDKGLNRSGLAELNKCAEVFLYGAGGFEKRARVRLSKTIKNLTNGLILLGALITAELLSSFFKTSAYSGLHAAETGFVTYGIAILAVFAIGVTLVKNHKTIYSLAICGKALIRETVRDLYLKSWALREKDSEALYKLINTESQIKHRKQHSPEEIEELFAIWAYLLVRRRGRLGFFDLERTLEKDLKRSINVLHHAKVVFRFFVDKYPAIIEESQSELAKQANVSKQIMYKRLIKKCDKDLEYLQAMLDNTESASKRICDYIAQNRRQFPSIVIEADRRLPNNYYRWNLAYKMAYAPNTLKRLYAQINKVFGKIFARLQINPWVWLHKINRVMGDRFIDHLRRHSIVRTYKKHVLLKPQGSKYKTVTGERPIEEIKPDDPRYEKHQSRVRKIMRAIDILSEKAAALNNAELKKRADNLRTTSTIIGLADMETNLMFSNIRKSIFRGIHSGRRREVHYLSMKLLDNLNIESPGDEDMLVLAALLNQGQRFLDKYNYFIKQKNMSQRRMRAEFKKEIETLIKKEEKQIIPPKVLKRKFEELAFKDIKLLDEEIMPHIDEHIRKTRQTEKALEEKWGHWTNEMDTIEFRDDYLGLERQFGIIADHLESIGNRLKAEDFYREQMRIAKLVQEFEGGLLTIETQEDMVLLLLHQGMYEDFLRELKTLLTGKRFPRPLIKDEQDLRQTFIKMHYESLREEIIYILESHKSMADWSQRIEINSVYRKALKLLDKFDREGRKPAPTILEAAKMNIEEAAEIINLDKAFVDKTMVMGNGLLARMRFRLHRLLAAIHIVRPRNILLIPKKVTTVSFQIPMEDGTIRTLWAFRALQNDARGAGKGGLRWLIVKGETLNEAKTTAVGLATLMTVKNGVIGIPYGGGKGDVVIDDEISALIKKFEDDALEIEKRSEKARDKAELLAKARKLRKKAEEVKARIIRGFARELTKKKAVGTFIDVPAPDMGTGERMMAWFVDEHLRVLAEEGRIHDSVIQGYLSKITPPKDDPLEMPYLDAYINLLEEDNNGLLEGIELGVVTGKPVGKGGSKGRTKATGFGGFLAFKAIQKSFSEFIDIKNNKVGNNLSAGTKTVLKKGISEMTVAIQGSGNVGEYNAWEFYKGGAKIILFQDMSGTLYNPDGIDIALLDKHLKRQTDGRWAPFSSVSEEFMKSTGARLRENEFFWGKQVDVMCLAATQNQVTESNAKYVNCGILLELANNPTSPKADKILRDKGILVIPDVLANVGGVTVSYFEWLQNIEGRYWSEISVNKMLEERINKETESVLKIAGEYDVDLRKAAFILSLARTTNAEIARSGRLKRIFKRRLPYTGYGKLDLDPETIEELRQIYREGKFPDLINRNEERHRREIAAIADKVNKKFDKARSGIVLVSGPKTSGKIQFSDRLRDNLIKSGREARCVDVDVVLDAYGETLKAQLDSEEEIYKRKIVKLKGLIGKLQKESSEAGKENEILILQGDYVLGEDIKKFLKGKQTFGVFVNTAPSMKLKGNRPLTSLDIRFIRHILTYNGILKQDPLDIARSWPFVRAHDLKYVYPTEDNPTWLNADITFNSALSYELPVLKPYVVPLLEEALHKAKKEEDYVTIKTIKHLLFILKDIPSFDVDDHIPPDSIMQQFIGGENLNRRIAERQPSIKFIFENHSMPELVRSELEKAISQGDILVLEEPLYVLDYYRRVSFGTLTPEHAFTALEPYLSKESSEEKIKSDLEVIYNKKIRIEIADEFSEDVKRLMEQADESYMRAMAAFVDSGDLKEAVGHMNKYIKQTANSHVIRDEFLIEHLKSLREMYPYASIVVQRGLAHEMAFYRLKKEKYKVEKNPFNRAMRLDYEHQLLRRQIAGRPIRNRKTRDRAIAKAIFEQCLTELYNDEFRHEKAQVLRGILKRFTYQEIEEFGRYISNRGGNVSWELYAIRWLLDNGKIRPDEEKYFMEKPRILRDGQKKDNIPGPKKAIDGVRPRQKIDDTAVLYAGEIGRIEKNAEKIVKILVNNILPNLDYKKGDIILALEDDIGSEDIQKLIMENIIKQLRRLDRIRGDIKLPHLYIKHGPAEKLAEELYSMKTRGKIKEENIILVTKEISFKQAHFDWLRDKAIITCVDDSTFPPDAYLPYLEIVLFTLAKWMSMDERDIRAHYGLIPNAKPLEDLTADEIQNLCNKTSIIKLIPNAARFNPETLVDIYETIQKFLVSA